VRRDASKSSPLFEVASLLLPLDHVARLIVTQMMARCDRVRCLRYPIARSALNRIREDPERAKQTGARFCAAL
jgi:hypothetical protein